MARRRGPFYIVLASASIAAVAVAAKYIVYLRGWDRIESLQLLTALLGGVIFVLAILLAGVLSDFKESERLVSDVTSTMRRIHADAAVVADGELLARMRSGLAEVAAALVEDLRAGYEVRTGRIYASLDRVDAALRDAARANGMTSPLRTLQVDITALVRGVDRLEMIVETTFIRAGYVFAGFAVAGALGLLTFTRMTPYTTGLALHAFASFLLVGLYLLIYDLDNPFEGSLLVSTDQLDKLAAWLRKA